MPTLTQIDHVGDDIFLRGDDGSTVQTTRSEYDDPAKQAAILAQFTQEVSTPTIDEKVAALQAALIDKGALTQADVDAKAAELVSEAPALSVKG